MVKNEQDIIEPFVRHTARLVDCMVILDNGSVDDTRHIIIQLARELGNVIVADCDTFAYTQAERMSRLLHCCQSAFFADYVLLLDADEFLDAPDRAALVDRLQRLQPGSTGLIHWQTFIRTPDEAEAGDPPRTIGRRRALEVPAFRKAILRLGGTDRSDLFVEQGNHAIRTVDGDPLPFVLLDDLILQHFPVRSVAQLVAKGVVGWMAYLARDPGARATSYGFQWRDVFDRAVSGRIGPEELADISMHYSQTRPPVDWAADVVPGEPPAGYTRRYSDGSPADALTLVARSWERSLAPPAALLDLADWRDAVGASPAGMLAGLWDDLRLDVAPFRFIAELDQPDSVLDLGCGIGAYLPLFKALGATRLVGVDRILAATVFAGDHAYYVRDLTRPLSLDHMFDLVICTEVAAMLPAKGGEMLLDNTTRYAGRTIVFSSAAPGQPGDGLINLQPIEYWLEQFAARGWHPDLMLTLGVRALSTLSWFRRNLVVLRRADQPLDAQAAPVLAAIGARPFGWYQQAPGIRQQPFAEALPTAAG